MSAKSPSVALPGRSIVECRRCRCASTKASGWTPNSVVPIAEGAVQVIYKTPDGALKERMLGRADEASIAVAVAERPWAFDGDGVPQTDEYAPVAPNGAQGYPRLTINVTST